MRRLPVRALLFGWACVMLGMKGCPDPTVGLRPGDTPQGAVGRTQQAAGADAPFRLPGDAGGDLLGRVLPPEQPPAVLPDPGPAGPRPLPLPRLGAMVVRPPETAAELPRWPGVVKKAPPLPEMVLEEGLEDTPPEIAPPAKQTFVAGKRAREDAPDAALPPALPVMGRQTPDRVSLDDATAEVSTRAVLAAPPPGRTKPAPFRRTAAPDPFENRLPLTVRPPAEGPDPVAATPRPPTGP
jgi:hypothetical protein